MIAHQRDGEHDRFPVVRVSEIDAVAVSQNWLIEELWTASSVGWVAGLPKSLKSWTALEMAVSVASGTPCLGRFKVHDRGNVLVYLAEDSLRAVRERLDALAQRHGLAIGELEIDVITASSMRLDLGRDQLRLEKTVRALSPRMLVLDPLVRIHRADENSSAEISSLLAYLRGLQRQLNVSVVVVHHVRKNLTPSQATGQGLRGSGDLHAWSDCASYLRRKGDNIVVTIEHRSAPTPTPFSLRLVCEHGPPHLEIVELGPTAPDALPVEDSVLRALQEAGTLTRSALRQRLSVRNERLGRALERLLEDGVIERTSDGWTLTDRSVPPVGMNGNGTIASPPETSELSSDDVDPLPFERN